MNRVPMVPLEELMATRQGSVDPSKFASETFALYSIPAFDSRRPEVLTGGAIGSTKQVVQPEDVLLSKIVPHIRRSWIVGPKGEHRQIASGEWIVFRNPRVVPEYLRHALLSDDFHAQFMQTVSGVGGSLLRARPAQVAKIQIPLPPLTEQRRIAAILDKADALRTKRREALAQLDRLAQAIFVDMFGDLFVNSKNYPISRLGDACDVRDGTHDSPLYVSDGYPLVTSKNLRNGKIDTADVNYISEVDYNEINRRSKVDFGDILLPMIGTIGNPVLVDEQPSFAIKNMALIKFKTKSPTREFVFQFLRGDCFDRLVASKNKGGTQKFLALGEIRGLPTPVPPEASQNEFSQRVQAIAHARKRYEEALDATNALFASLQHRAFSGEL